MSDAVFSIIGIIFGFIVFWKSPVLLKRRSLSESDYRKVSVIVPARNEEENIANLLRDLSRQTVSPYEIICVDDQSSDNTASYAIKYGAKLVKVEEKPKGWTGKSWACQTGADSASGEALLFLDADVRLNRYAVSSILSAFNVCSCPISIQPYYLVEKLYGQLSLFFNLVGTGANGLGLPFKTKSVGLFGSVIMISAKDYSLIGGHFSVRKSITDDLALGETLKKKKIDYKLFLGRDIFAVKMYSQSLREVFDGWSKNFATGSLKTPLYMLVMVTLWLGSCISAALNLFSSTLKLDYSRAMLFLTLYTVIVLQTFFSSREMGSYRKTASIFYPISLLFFLITFAASVFKKLVLKKTKWKGREIDLRR